MTLYQHQRSVLRQRAVEKDDYIARLSRERGEMQVSERHFLDRDLLHP